MFLNNRPATPYADPWDLALSERIKMLRAGKVRVAYFYETANNSTFRYRAYNMVQVINEGKKGDVSASYFFLADLPLIEEIAHFADVLVICRSRYCNRIKQLVTQFRDRGKRVLFDIDDLVFDTSYAHLIINTLDQNVEAPEVWDYWFSYIARMGETLRLCDGVITTNEYLASKVVEYSGRPVSVIPNFANKEQLNLSDALFCDKSASGFARDGKVHLGYFSGSPSHNLDYAMIAPALAAVLDSDLRIELVVAGYIEAGPLLSKFGDRVQYHSFQDYVNLQRLVSRVEFNLMPLQSNVFTHCKSELKYFEAALAGTVSIASPTYTYAAAIQDGKNGYIAEAQQWKSAIQRAIADMKKYPDMAVAAYADARAKYGWFYQRERILRALGVG